MQKELDSHRADLVKLGERLSYFTSAVGFTNPEKLFNAVTDFNDLEWYRRSNIGWGVKSPDHWSRYQGLLSSEQDIRQRMGRYLTRLAQYAERAGRDDIAQWAVGSYSVLLSLPDLEYELFKARREWGRLLTAYTKQTLPLGAANQITDLASTGMQSLQQVANARDALLAPHSPLPNDVGTQIGYRAAAAAAYGAGNCGEQSDFLAAEACRLLPKTLITRLNYNKGSHLYIVLGPPNFPESAVVDPWPHKASVLRESAYGLKVGRKTEISYSFTADGRNLLALGSQYLRSPQVRPPRVSAMSIAAGTKYLREKYSRQAAVTHYITSTGGYNSDSDPESQPKLGLPLSEASLKATAANNFAMPRASAHASPPGGRHRSGSAFPAAPGPSTGTYPSAQPGRSAAAASHQPHAPHTAAWLHPVVAPSPVVARPAPEQRSVRDGAQRKLRRPSRH
ncbi:hypothetical protein AB0911_38535 [Streptomyces nigra]|uniref:hypothetical protein n=1 Tax=Streptomyces nigra TaxID=1827580 RepID=UPI003455DEAC